MALIDTQRRQRLLDVRAQNLGTANGVLVAGDVREPLGECNAEQALEKLLTKVKASTDGGADIAAVAHRIVHGGSQYTSPVLINDEVLKLLTTAASLAPLHNPPALAAVATLRRALPNLPHVAVFDTAFHATLPRRAREYALPVDLAARHDLRRYGFHGISHAHVMEAAAQYLKTEPQTLRIVSCHLGNGASVAAIEYGRSVETSMGLTPLEGLVMGTRAGDVDPGVLLRLLESGEYDERSLGRLLNEESGLKGLTGTEDMAAIEARAAAGDEGCRLAILLYTHRVRKYIGAYAAVMGGVDVIAFTGGVGENSPLIRHRTAQRLDFLGAVIDEDRNRDVRLSAAEPLAVISDEHSRTRLLVVRADEETSMADAAARLLANKSREQPLPPIPVAVSARHAHLSQATLDALFGPGHMLTPRNELSQPGQFAAKETVTLIGPRGSLERVRILGPPRDPGQIEISRSDEFVLGIDAPVRISGDVDNTPGIVVEGPRGRVTLRHGVICARRHIHMHPDDAARFGVKDHDTVQVHIDSDGRDLVFGDVTVRVSPAFRLEMHVDMDEANAAGIEPGDTGEVYLPTGAHAAVTRR